MAKADFQELLDTGLPFAKQMLLECGEFIPFGIRLPSIGHAELMAGDTGDEHPKSLDVMFLLEEALKQLAERNQIRGGAICFMGRVTLPGSNSPVDVATFRMAHVDGEMLDVFLPYDIEGNGQVKFGSVFASLGTSLNLRSRT